MVVSPRVGNTNKEQYVIIYKHDKYVLERRAAEMFERISVLDSFVFDEGGEDLFIREPFITHVNIIGTNIDFYVSNIHTQPTNAYQEIYSMKAMHISHHF